MLRSCDPRIVDKHIDSAVSFLDRLEQLDHGLRLHHIAFKGGMRRFVEPIEFLDQGLGRR